MRTVKVGLVTLPCWLLLAVLPARADVMTFDSLAADFAEYSTYTENNITLAAVNGPPAHFHADVNPNNGTTAATIFSSDGTPQQITYGGGQPFALKSIDVVDIDSGSGPVVFTASSGATRSVSETGLVTFGSDFVGITSVTIDVPDPANDRFIEIDDVAVQSLALTGGATATPEPGSLVLGGLGAVGLLASRWRRTPRAR